jgi:hypothetical protein
VGVFGWTVLGSVAAVVCAAAAIVIPFLVREKSQRSREDTAARRDAGSLDDSPVPVAVRLAPRPEFVEGRDDLLAELDAQFASVAEAGKGPGVVVLSGPGGAGKTTVAVEYAYRHLSGPGPARFRAVWQFATWDPAALAAGFSALAAQLGTGDAGDPVARVHAALAARRGDWLLLFDNVPGPAAVQGMLPPAGVGQVLITSQYALWPGGRMLDVPALDRATAAAFLLRRTRAASTDKVAAGELADQLGELPLALEQAAAYMLAVGRSIPQYLSIFRARRADLLDRGDPAGYDKRVSTTWALAFAELDKRGSSAAALLRVVACCAAEDIPLRLLLRPRPELNAKFGAEVMPLLLPLLEDDVARSDAVAALRAYSLISAPHDYDDLVSVHRLVQVITLAQLPADVAGAWCQATAEVIDAALPDDPGNREDRPAFAELLPHAQAALSPASEGMAKIAGYLGAIGNYAAARDLQQQIVKAREMSIGADHPDTLTARGGLAFWTGQAGDAAAARDQFAELLPVQQRVRGADDPETLTIRANLARWTGAAGDPAAARDQFAELLPVRERVSGAEDPSTLTARANLAHYIGEAGDPAAARDQFAELLPVRERVSGAKDPETLAASSNLARFTGEAGDPAAARDLYAKLVPTWEEASGAEHPATLNARDNLARFTGEAGDPAAARDQYAALIPIWERVSGAENPNSLKARHNFEYWRRQVTKSKQDQAEKPK